MLPYLKELEAYNIKYFVDATPSYLGKDPILLEKIADKTGLKIITNTGFYGAVKNKFIPTEMFSATAEEMSKLWIDEFENGIGGTSIKPGFIKISVDNTDPLDSIDQKLVKAAALTHLSTGLTIGSHTGAAKGLWPQLEILKEYDVSPEAFIWIHAQNEKDNEAYLKAAEMSCWISLDGIGRDGQLEKHIDKILFAKQNGFLHKILISHDSGWFDPQKETQNVRPFTNIFTKLIPALKAKGFTESEINLLLSVNPSKAFSISIKKI
jgi:phosphotriesterase-related protein